jgi:5-methylcytosine-specific restriction endonuclease McrA
MGRGRKAGHGSGWIARNVREAIYARDGHTCTYCLCAVHGPDAGPRVTVASLDHVLACELGGGNEPANLVTACIGCNSAKRDLSITAFVAVLARRGVDVSRSALASRISRRRAKDLTPFLAGV